MPFPRSRMSFGPQLQLLYLNQHSISQNTLVCVARTVMSSLLEFLLLKFVSVENRNILIKHISLNQTSFFFFFLPEHYLFNLTGYNRGTVCLHLKYLFCWCFMMFFFFLLGGKCKHQVLLWGRRHRIVSLLSVQAWLSFSSLNSVCPVVSLNIKES